ncbi:hypothetical protein NP233_g314 [Leucocoprinus birnbaumii]|uniref:Uncharacterized protein n=1 Tax=Leucocoprinus birnbaumii TaxID=56174 RepID=A0AAD5W254_9AGAR|nr:hypothetical protein NP233_g314 [Leucocoprinus birnbaumii]
MSLSYRNLKSPFYIKHPAMRNHPLSHLYKLHFTRRTLIDEDIPHLKFDKLVPFSQLYEIGEGTICNIIAIIVNASKLDVHTRCDLRKYPNDVSYSSTSLATGSKQQYGTPKPQSLQLSPAPSSHLHVKISGFRGHSVSILSASTIEVGSKKDLSEFIGQTRFADKESVERGHVLLRRVQGI